MNALQKIIDVDCLLESTDFVSDFLNQERLVSSRNKSYLYSYDGIVEYFRSETLTSKTSIAGLYMVYGWMQKIPDFFKNCDSTDTSFKISDLPKVIQQIKQIDDLTSKEIISNLVKNLVPLVNGSHVGTSKFLHFVTPEIFPIWDSKVALAVYGFKNNFQVEKLENYLRYFNDVQELRLTIDSVSQMKICSKATQAIKKELNIETKLLTFTRVIELLCFYSSVNENKC